MNNVTRLPVKTADPALKWARVFLAVGVSPETLRAHAPELADAAQSLLLLPAS